MWSLVCLTPGEAVLAKSHAVLLPSEAGFAPSKALVDRSCVFFVPTEAVVDNKPRWHRLGPRWSPIKATRASLPAGVLDGQAAAVTSVTTASVSFAARVCKVAW